MTTKNLVPRTSGQGQIGTSAKKWSQANFVAGSFDSLTVGGSAITAASDIEGVTAGDGLSGGGTSGTVSLALDLNELTAVAVDVASDSIAIIDANDSNGSKKESIADLVSAIAGSGLSASGGQLSVSGGSLASLSDTAVSSPSSGHILVYDGSDSFDNKPLIGDATLAADGTLTLSSSASPTFAGLNMSNNKITSLATPTSDADAANKSYVDNVAQGLVVKDSVAIKFNNGLSSSNFSFNNGTNGVGATITRNSNGSINDSGELGATINLSLNDRVLISGWYRSHSGGNYSDGGIYFVSHAGDSSNPYVLTRALDADTPEKLKSCFVFVEKGTEADKGFVMNLDNVTTIGTSDITFAQFTAVPYNDFTEVSADSTPELGGNLNTNGKYLYNSSNSVVEVRPSGHNASVQGSGSLRIRSSDNVGPGKISLRGSGGNDSSTEYVTIQAPANSSMSGTSYTLTLPTDDGAYSQRFLYSNGSGVLSWVGITAFKNIAVSGQSNVVADTAGASLPNDTLTLVAGSGMTITTDTTAKSVTFASSGGGGGSRVEPKFVGENTNQTSFTIGTVISENNYMSTPVAAYNASVGGDVVAETVVGSSEIERVYVCKTGLTSITLPTSIGLDGFKVQIKRIGSTSITINTNGSQTIDGDATKTLDIQYASLTLISDDFNWYVI